MLRKLSMAFAVLALVAGCKGKQSQSDQGIESGMGGAPTIDSSAMNFDPMGSDSGRISGLNTVYFPYDRSSLDSQAKADLRANAEWMKKNSGVRVQIEGHCDSRGTIEYNVALGERRANAVKSYMMSLGIPSERLPIISYGEEKPLVQGESEEAWSKNRRANFVPLQ